MFQTGITLEPPACTHDEENHSFDKDCSYWPYGFHTHMHSLGDKYDSPGLRKHSCMRLGPSTGNNERTSIHETVHTDLGTVISKLTQG